MNWLEENLLVLVYAIWFSLEFLSTSMLSELSSFQWYLEMINSLAYLKYFLLGCVLLLRKRTLKQWCIISLIAVLLFITAAQAEYIILFSAYLLICAVEERDIRKLIKVTAVLSAFLIFLIISLSLSGVIKNLFFERKGYSRYALGFEHPNNLGFRVFIMVACWFWLRKDCIKIWDYVICVAMIIFVWAIPNSWTACMGMAAVMLMALIKPIYNKMGDSLKKTVLIGMSAVACISNFGVVLTSIWFRNGGILAALNKLLSGRLYLSKEAIDYYGVHIWGQVTDNVIYNPQSKTIIVDCGYVSILLSFGIIVYLLVSFLYVYSMYKEARNLHFENVCFLMIISLYMINEKACYLIYQNVLLVLIAVPFFNFPDSFDKKRVFDWILSFFQRKQKGEA